MTFEEMVVALVGAIGAFALVGYLGAKMIDLIKSWINRNKAAFDEEAFDRLAQAFIQYRKNTERRIQNLEAIIAGEEEVPSAKKQVEEPKQAIEIEGDEEKKASETRSGNLRNMLRE